MKNKSLIVIFVIIIALHWIGIHFFFLRKPADDVKKVEKAEEVQAEKKEIAIPKKSKSFKEKIASKSDNSNFGKKFDYRYAVQGNIPALPDSKKATGGILVDLGSRKVLWAKNPRKSVPIASMSKMMTLLLALEAIKKREDVSLDTPVKVSVAAYRIGGSQVWLDPKETFPLSELLKTVAIKSANDSAYLVAEFVGNGDVSLFVQNMNKRAKDIKMPGTHFTNPHGLPEKSSKDDNKSTPEGMAILAEYLLEYPLAVKWASTPKDVFREGTKKPLILHNHNSLVKNCSGVDGMKTGYIRRSGYCTTVTCKRGNRRLVAVVTGFPLNSRRGRERDNFVRKLLDWGYRQANKLDNKK